MASVTFSEPFGLRFRGFDSNQNGCSHLNGQIWQSIQSASSKPDDFMAGSPVQLAEGTATSDKNIATNSDALCW